MWSISPRKDALKILARAPEKERRQVWRALDQMKADPMTGDVEKLEGQRANYRRKFGHWRVFFDLHQEQQLVDVVAIERRTTTTYRKR